MRHAIPSFIALGLLGVALSATPGSAKPNLFPGDTNGYALETKTPEELKAQRLKREKLREERRERRRLRKLERKKRASNEQLYLSDGLRRP